MSLVFCVDATCDVPAEFIKKNNIATIGLRYIIGNDDGVWHGTENEADIKKFFGRMKAGEISRTSLVTYEDAAAVFEPIFKAGNDIMHFGLSSGLALTWENAKKAGETLAKQYKRQFLCCDTKTASACNFMLLKIAMQMHAEKKSLKEIGEKIDKLSPSLSAFFTVDSLVYLQRGGRVSKAKLIIGSLLNIKPILKVDADGKLDPFMKWKGRLGSLNFIANQISNLDESISNEVTIIHAVCEQDAEYLKEQILKIKPNVKVDILPLGVIIGSHAGPTTIGLLFFNKNKRA